MKTITIYAATIENTKYGIELLTDITEQGLHNQLIAYVQKNWTEQLDLPIPSVITMDEVHNYFRENRREFLEIHDPATLPLEDEPQQPMGAVLNAIRGINWELLRKQKQWLLSLPTHEHADGLINLLDAIQDKVVEAGMFSEKEVFDLQDPDKY